MRLIIIIAIVSVSDFDRTKGKTSIPFRVQQTYSLPVNPILRKIPY